MARLGLLSRFGLCLASVAICLTPARSETAEAVFAMGCFWCGEEAMEKVAGVISAESGYTGGTVENPTYYEVVGGGTGHYEAVRVYFDDEVITYSELLQFFLHNVDPVQSNGQFCDKGDSYLSAIFYLNDEQKAVAEETMQALALEKPEWEIATPVLPGATFYMAEDYHQDYYKKNPVYYYTYKYNCGREAQLRLRWGDEAYELYHPPAVAGDETGDGSTTEALDASATSSSYAEVEDDSAAISVSFLRAAFLMAWGVLSAAVLVW